MNFIFNDGGREKAGYKGKTGDCVVRAICIAANLPYDQVYKDLAEINLKTKTRHKHAGKETLKFGTFVKSVGFKRYMEKLGWEFIPTMTIGSGCKIHLTEGELPMGRLIVSLSKHYTTVIDGVIHDTFSPEREVHCCEPDNGRELKAGEWRNSNGICRISRRCVYGYWRKKQ
jgi:hypothetical protein